MIEKSAKWHSISWREAIQKMVSSEKEGLTQKEVKIRQKELGKNLLPKEKPLSKLAILLGQFKSPLMYILITAGGVVLFFKEYTDAIVIFGAVFLNTAVGFFQESKANDSLNQLKKIVKVSGEVIREGNAKMIDASEIVPGDILVLSPGDKVSADARLIEADNLKINEMALTGEWLPAEKKTSILKEKTQLADRDNMVYMGTVIEDGKGKAVVTSTGLETELGKIASMVKETKEEKTPLQKKITRFSRIVGLIIVAICAVIFIEGVVTGNTFLEMFTIAVSVAVAAIPEGLPVALTVILAIGMQNILKKKGLVRKLSAAETLGSTSIIATDKTGTLTEGRMQVAEIVTQGKADDQLALKIATLCNEAFIENPDESMEEWIIRGRPTDKALLLAGTQAGINKKHLENKMQKLTEIPFSTQNKFLAKAFSETKKRDVLFVSGAPEKLLKMSKNIIKNGRKQFLTSKKEEEIRIDLENLSARGLRVVAVAQKEIFNLKDLFCDLSFVGLIALKDPVRKEVKKAMKTVRTAGIKPIIVTGDHKLTAKVVADEIGIKTEEKNIIEGRDLDNLSEKEFAKILDRVQIYARVEPSHKMRIIEAWQERGEVIAMTGDGINDTPALKKADIGMALGSGTEVAKEVSDLVLLSNSFNVIAAAIKEGRAIIDNIRKVITYLLSDSLTETILITVALMFGFPLPLVAVQILWVNLIEDGLPGIALAFEPKEKDLMKQKPYGHNVPLLTLEMKALIFIIGILTDFFLLALFFWLFKFTNYSIEHIRTIIFGGLAIDSIFYVFSCKSLRKNVWRINPFSNKFLIVGWIFGIAALVMALYLPPLQVLLETVPLGFIDWIILFVLGLINLALIELTKWFFIVKHKTD